MRYKHDFGQYSLLDMISKLQEGDINNTFVSLPYQISFEGYKKMPGDLKRTSGCVRVRITLKITGNEARRYKEDS